MNAAATLRTRVTLIVVAVAAAAVLITGLLTIPMVRTGVVAEARGRVAAQVDLLIEVGAPAGAAIRAGAAQGTAFARVRDGVVRGPAESYATADVLAALAGPGSYSGLVRGDAGAALVEARSTPDGTAVIGALPLRQVESAQRLATGRILLALAAGLLVALVAGWLLARWLDRPLRATARVARRIAAGERGVPVPSTGPAEVREVAGALTALDAALAASEARQREFLLSISHELRTPLAALRGYGEALADGLVPTDATEHVGQTLVAETERLDLFVGDLLALARLEVDDFRLEISELDVASTMSDAVEAWSGRAATLGIRLTAEPAPPMPLLRSDPRRVRQVLDGLIENALRATPDGGRVNLRARPAGDDAVDIEVADTGAGLAPDDLAVAFDRGALHARYRESRPVGTGLGLSIAARLVGRLGGTIAARAAEGGGTVFTVRLGTAPAGTGRT